MSSSRSHHPCRIGIFAAHCIGCLPPHPRPLMVAHCAIQAAGNRHATDPKTIYVQAELGNLIWLMRRNGRDMGRRRPRFGAAANSLNRNSMTQFDENPGSLAVEMRKLGKAIFSEDFSKFISTHTQRCGVAWKMLKNSVGPAQRWHLVVCLFS